MSENPTTIFSGEAPISGANNDIYYPSDILWDDGSPILWDDGSTILWEGLVVTSSDVDKKSSYPKTIFSGEAD